MLARALTTPENGVATLAARVVTLVPRVAVLPPRSAMPAPRSAKLVRRAAASAARVAALPPRSARLARRAAALASRVGWRAPKLTGSGGQRGRVGYLAEGALAQRAAHGAYALEVAEREGHAEVAEYLRAHLPVN